MVNSESSVVMVGVPGETTYYDTKCAVRGVTESLGLEMKETNRNLQIHCVHPGHIGTNIAATARMSDEDFKDNEARSSIFTKNAPKTQQEMGELFKEGGMHPSKAAKIILNGVKKNKSRIFIGLDAKLLDLSQRLFPKNYHKTWLFFMPLLALFRDKKPLKSID